VTIQESPPGSRPRVPGAPAPLRRPDYRLRGLDLEAHGLAEVQPRAVRKTHPSRRRRRRRLMFQWFVMLTLLAITALLLRAFVIRPYAVESTSMVPNIAPGTDVLVVRPTLLTGSVKLGDIVVFHRPAGARCSDEGSSSTELVKRVIGLPGDSIWSVDEQVYINGRALAEPGWYNSPFGEIGPSAIPPTVLGPDHYYVLGDNRTDPCDSRAFGAITGSDMIGKVVATTTRNGHPFLHIF
jgi:signal peptidase I